MGGGRVNQASMEDSDTIAAGKMVRLRKKRLSDANNDYKWQTDPELARLDAAPPLALSLAQYVSIYSDELKNSNPNRRQFAIETLEGRHIGNCLIYGVNESRGEAELGIMIGDSDYRNKGYGTDAVRTLVDYVFSETGLRRIHLKTLESNRRAQRSFAKAGFTAYSRMNTGEHSFVLMELRREDWGRRNKLMEAGTSTEYNGGKIVHR